MNTFGGSCESLKWPAPLPDGWPPGPRHVLVVGAFGDGADQVITDAFV